MSSHGITAKFDEIRGRLRKIENAPLPAWLAGAQPKELRGPLDPAKVLRELLSDPALGEAVRLKMLQLEQERTQ
jgi:hypothetical protein